MLTIECYYDEEAILDSERGCWRARIETHPEYHEAGASAAEAVDKLVHSMTHRGESGDKSDYNVVMKS